MGLTAQARYPALDGDCARIFTGQNDGEKKDLGRGSGTAALKESTVPPEAAALPGSSNRQLCAKCTKLPFRKRLDPRNLAAIHILLHLR